MELHLTMMKIESLKSHKSTEAHKIKSLAQHSSSPRMCTIPQGDSCDFPKYMHRAARQMERRACDTISWGECPPSTSCLVLTCSDSPASGNSNTYHLRKDGLLTSDQLSESLNSKSWTFSNQVSINLLPYKHNSTAASHKREQFQNSHKPTIQTSRSPALT